MKETRVLISLQSVDNFTLTLNDDTQVQLSGSIKDLLEKHI